MPLNDHLFDADFCRTGWCGENHRKLWTLEELIQRSVKES